MQLDSLKANTKFLTNLPGVEAIFLSGSRAQGHASENSDIDLFILATPGRIWTARFFVYITLFLKRKMRRSKNTKNLFCPNHFITTSSLKIQEKDAYSAHLFSHNIPLHDMNNYFVQFAKINQKWVQKFGESFDKEILKKRTSPLKIKVPTIFERWIESIFKYIQKAKILRHPDTKLLGSKIILNDTELRFHPRPRNKEWKD